MFAIGFPVGKYSLKVWKHPEKYPKLGRLLFPMNGMKRTVGEQIYHTDLPTTMSILNTHDAIHDDDKLGMARYLTLQMLAWPLRLVYMVVVCMIALFLVQVGMVPTYGAKLLVRCGSCLDI